MLYLSGAFMRRLRAFTGIVLLCFSLNTVVPAQAAVLPYMPAPQQLIAPTPAYDLPLLKGMIFSSASPFDFTFLLKRGDRPRNEVALRLEVDKLSRYFLAALTLPEDDLWVNLSPYEKDRISSDALARTDLGKDMLGEDYVLKQFAASLTYPGTKAGERYWGEMIRNNGKAVSAFQKVWIVPGKITLVEADDRVAIQSATLKVMCEEDYVAQRAAIASVGSTPNATSQGASGARDAAIASFKNHLLPLIEKEVNQGKHFARLRQIYHAIILATWFKKKLKDTVLGEVYFDQSKLIGVRGRDPQVREKIYSEYVKAFNRGVYNYVKTERVGANGRSPVQKASRRRYFSGGEVVTMAAVREATTSIALSHGQVNRAFAADRVDMRARMGVLAFDRDPLRKVPHLLGSLFSVAGPRRPFFNKDPNGVPPSSKRPSGARVSSAFATIKSVLPSGHEIDDLRVDHAAIRLVELIDRDPAHPNMTAIAHALRIEFGDIFSLMTDILMLPLIDQVVLDVVFDPKTYDALVDLGYVSEGKDAEGGFVRVVSPYADNVEPKYFNAVRDGPNYRAEAFAWAVALSGSDESFSDHVVLDQDFSVPPGPAVVSSASDVARRIAALQAARGAYRYNALAPEPLPAVMRALSDEGYLQEVAGPDGTPIITVVALAQRGDSDGLSGSGFFSPARAEQGDSYRERAIHYAVWLRDKDRRSLLESMKRTVGNDVELSVFEDAWQLYVRETLAMVRQEQADRQLFSDTMTSFAGHAIAPRDIAVAWRRYRDAQRLQATIGGPSLSLFEVARAAAKRMSPPAASKPAVQVGAAVPASQVERTQYEDELLAEVSSFSPVGHHIDGDDFLRFYFAGSRDTTIANAFALDSDVLGRIMSRIGDAGLAIMDQHTEIVTDLVQATGADPLAHETKISICRQMTLLVARIIQAQNMSRRSGGVVTIPRDSLGAIPGLSNLSDAQLLVMGGFKVRPRGRKAVASILPARRADSTGTTEDGGLDLATSKAITTQKQGRGLKFSAEAEFAYLKKTKISGLKLTTMDLEF